LRISIIHCVTHKEAYNSAQKPIQRLSFVS